MDKLELINKEIKELKVYLTNLYNNKKEYELNKVNDTLKERLNEEITAISDVIDILKDLKDKYISGTINNELVNITKDNDNKYYNYLSLYPYGIPKNDWSIFIKEARLKEALDNINEIFLSKDEIFNYLYNYNEIMRLARNNPDNSIWNIFTSYMQVNDKDNANFVYYEKMIKLHMLYDNLTLLSIIKDEDFEEINACDDEMSETDKKYGLAFLKDGFLNPKDATRFKKHHIFNFVRNAIYHSDMNELYKISSNCENIYINLKMTKPIPFNFKIHNFGIYNMLTYISDYSHHAPTFIIKNQSSINMDNIYKNHNRRMRELNKLTLTRLSLDNKSTDNKRTILEEMHKNKMMFSQKESIKLLSNYSNVSEIEYPFTKEQRELFCEKIEFFLPILSGNFKYFLAPILYNYMHGSIYKCNFYKYDFLINQLYLLDSNNSINDIFSIILCDFDNLSHNKKIDTYKDSVFNYIDKDVDYSKSILLYNYDNNIREDMNDAILFTYSFCSLNNQKTLIIDGISYDLEHIRNAFTHGRWICKRIGNSKYYYLYDDEDLLVNPEDAYWSNKYSYQELMNICNILKNNYINNNNLKKSLVKTN